MDREIEGFPAAIELLELLYEMPAPRREKCETLFRLACRSTGYIVELGTYWGTGFIALNLGADEGQGVWTVDDYAPKKGWAGEKYGPEDKELFYFYCDKASVDPHLLEKSFEDAANFWNVPIGLLFWDGGQYSLNETMAHWEPLISEGGILALHDTYSNLFKANEYMNNMVNSGKYCQYEVMPGGVHVAVKV